MFGDHGGEEVVAESKSIRAHFMQRGARPERLDDFEAVGLSRAEQIRDRFVPHFYFGCEADDPLVPWAFSEQVNPFGARMRAMLGSDISHWDVVDMTDPVVEAYESVEKGMLSEDDFREFALTNGVRLHAGMNPEFFAGTVLETAATEILVRDSNE